MKDSRTQTLLLAGATGMLGSRIARHLLALPNTRVRLLVRDRNNASSNATLAPFLDQGCEIVEGELANLGSLERATQNVDVIVSALQGGPDVIIDGQAALAKAGKHNGVRRLIPSDFALDLFKATPGEHNVRYARQGRRRHQRDWSGADQRPARRLHGHVSTRQRGS